jgi:CHU_C Type IX secretion signal domain
MSHPLGERLLRLSIPMLIRAFLRRSLGLLALVLVAVSLKGQSLRRQWDRTLGGTGLDNFHRLQPTADGGYIVGGSSDSGVSGDKTEPRRGNSSPSNSNYDYWIAKLDAQGNKVWDRTFGGDQTDNLTGLQQTADGGYILGGTSTSGISGDRTQPLTGPSSYWLVKVDAQGVKQWDRAFSTSSMPTLSCLQQTTDGGYILGGHHQGGLPQTPPTGDQTEPNQGDQDGWLVRLDANGNKLWDRVIGGSDFDHIQDLQQTADGGYVVGCWSTSGVSGLKSEPGRGGNDYWVLKLDALGRKQWDRTYGGAASDVLYALRQTPDGGYLLGGESRSGVSGEKIDAQGNRQWDRTLGGSGVERVYRVRPAADGGCWVAGQSDSGISGDKTRAGLGQSDYWLVKLSAAGTKEWDESYGGSGYDDLRDLAATSDGGLVLGGVSTSGVSCGKTHANWGDLDYWVIKLLPAAGQPVSAVAGDTLLCGSSSGVLRVVSGVAPTAYQWSTGATTPTITVTQPGQYAVTTTLCDGSTSTATAQVRRASAQISGPAIICVGSSATLTAQAPGATAYRWNTGQTTAAITVGQAGSYTLTATFPGGCSLSATHALAAPQLAVSGDSLLCSGRNGQLLASGSNITAYQWSTGATTPGISVTQPGLYSVTATYTGGCTSSAQLRVRRLPDLPQWTLGADTTVCEATGLTLRAPVLPGVPLTYRWSDNSTGATLRTTGPGLYTLQVSSSCATQTLSRRVAERSCLFVPNVLTANQDGANDLFVVRGLVGGPWELQVYTRWGKQVYQASNYQNDWGRGVAPGLYYYLLRPTGPGPILKGWVEVLR